MKKRIVIAILCAAISAGITGCGKPAISTNTTQTNATSKNNTKSKSAQSDAEKQSRDIFAMDTYMTVTAYGEHASDAVDKAESEIKR